MLQKVLLPKNRWKFLRCNFIDNINNFSHKIKKPVGKPPIPISLKLGQLSKPNDSSIFQRRLQQGAMKSRNLGLIGNDLTLLKYDIMIKVNLSYLIKTWIYKKFIQWK